MLDINVTALTDTEITLERHSALEGTPMIAHR
jgi:hypothetical protein